MEVESLKHYITWQNFTLQSNLLKRLLNTVKSTKEDCWCDIVDLIMLTAAINRSGFLNRYGGGILKTLYYMTKFSKRLLNTVKSTKEDCWCYIFDLIVLTAAKSRSGFWNRYGGGIPQIFHFMPKYYITVNLLRKTFDVVSLTQSHLEYTHMQISLSLMQME